MELKNMLQSLFSELKERLQYIKQIRKEAHISLKGLEYRLGNAIQTLERLRPHKITLEFWAEDSYDETCDIFVLEHWVKRIDCVEDNIEDNKLQIQALYKTIYDEIVLKIVKAEPIGEIEYFFYQAHPFIPYLVEGLIGFYDLDSAYDWEQSKFKTQFIEEIERL